MKWLSQNSELVWQLTWQHLALAIPPILLALLVSVPLGYLAHRRRRWRSAIVTGTGALYAIPSLPLLIVIPTVTGTPLRSPATMITALTIYGVALLVGGVAAAFDSVGPEIRHSALALGYSRWRLFWQVELPLAGPVLLASLRVVITATVALVTIGAVIGIASLGTLFTDGFSRGILAEVLAGLVLTVAVALLLDRLAVLTARILLPWRTVR